MKLPMFIIDAFAERTLADNLAAARAATPRSFSKEKSRSDTAAL
jgi:hypothetical protein